MTPATLRLGTRRSNLAVTQSGSVARALEQAHPGLAVELVPIVTHGDRHKGELAKVGGKGLFTQELEEGLLSGELDLAVHSLKDLPVELRPGLVVAAFPRRADPRDALVSEEARDLAGLAAGGLILTGSLRRQALVRMARPDLMVEPIRGNVETRLRLWRQKRAAGVILAGAGLDRLGMGDLPEHRLDPATFIPAPGQGTLAIEVAAGSAAEELCRVLDHPETARAAHAERRIVAAFGGDCTLPLAAWCRPDGDGGTVRLTAVLATPDGAHVARGEAAGADVEEVATACEAALRADGAEEVLAAIEAQR